MTYINNNKIKGLGGIKRAYLNGTLIFQSFKKDEEVISPYDITAKFNVTSTTEPTSLCYFERVPYIAEMAIDGVKVNVTSAHTFNTLGEHTVGYMLLNNTSIFNYLFNGCTSLTTIEITDSVTNIGSCAFSGCTSLSSVTIPDSVKSISDHTFQSCSSLTSVTIPNSVTSIGGSAFEGCTSLSSVTISYNLTKISNWIFQDCTSLSSIIIPDGVDSIGNGAFFNCTSLSSITIPSNVANIGSSTFAYCTSLSSITIPFSVKSIGGAAFEGCTSLSSFTIPSIITSIDNSTFRDCTSLTTIEIPNSVTSIGISAFTNCVSLSSVTLPSSLTNISDYAFTNCTSLSLITCNATTAPTLGGNNVFFHLPTTGTLTYPSGSDYDTWLGYLGWGNVSWPTIEYDITAKFNVTSTTSPTKLYYSEIEKYINEMEIDGVKVDVTSAYTFNTLGEHTVEYMLKDKIEINSGAFSNCTNLTSIVIKEGLQTIRYRAFYRCTSLSSITIPSSVLIIEGYVFYRCTSLSSITCYGTTAPLLKESNTFYNLPTTGTLTYPCESDYSTWLSELGWENTCIN